jgi:hypothetical protein
MTTFAASIVGLFVSVATGQETIEQKCVISVERIWDRSAHCAFTGLALYRGQLYCTFREASAHIPGLNGVVRIIRSGDGMNWQSVGLLEEPHVDLRDPKICVTPDDRLMINTGASFYEGSRRLAIESRVSFSEDGARFSPPRKVVFPDAMITGADWLWRVTWHEGVAWGCVQQVPDKNQRTLRLVRSSDGIRYAEVAALDVDSANETTLCFLPDQTMLAMIRRDGGDSLGRIGLAAPPYTDWKFLPSNRRFGGPELIRLPSGAWLAGSRRYAEQEHRTALWRLDPTTGQCHELLTLPSGGDTSYPGFAIAPERNRLYVSYYSSHEGRTSIYLATLRLDALEREAGGS